jgi:cytidine deaminase
VSTRSGVPMKKKRSSDESLLEDTIGRLMVAASEARKRAYAPYSNYKVGAAILVRSGAVFVGCNVENATYGATICAERSAIAKMVSAGERDPIICVVATGGSEPGSPCGICRQVLSEFADDMLIVLIGEGPGGKIVRRDANLAALLPDAFRLKGHAKKRSR